MITRRKCLALFTGLPLIGTTVASAASPARLISTLRQGEWNIVWGGWRQPYNQLIVFGVWLAYRKGDPIIRYRTTLGSGGSCPNMGVIDLTYDWKQPRPQLFEIPTDGHAEAEELKRLTLMELRTDLL